MSSRHSNELIFDPKILILFLFQFHGKLNFWRSEARGMENPLNSIRNPFGIYATQIFSILIIVNFLLPLFLLWFKAYQDDFLNISSLLLSFHPFEQIFSAAVKWKRIIDLSFCLLPRRISRGTVYFGAFWLCRTFNLNIYLDDWINQFCSSSSCPLSLSFSSSKKKSPDWICKRVLSLGNSFCSTEEDAKEIENN